MKNDNNKCIIGGYDSLSRSFFNETKKDKNITIFINVSETIYKKKNIFNLKIYELKKIIAVLNKYNISKIIFLGKISRPNLAHFKNDGEIEKYIPDLLNAYQKGDGYILSLIVGIFEKYGFKVISPNKVTNKFFFNEGEFDKNVPTNDKNDIRKSVNILSDLSKYDNAQSIIMVNGYIIAIEAVEGTDNLLKRSILIRKDLAQLSNKNGLLIKIPKKYQSKLIDLPVIGPKTINLVKKANLKGIAVSSKYTMVENKLKTLNLVREFKLKIYDADLIK